ncbi:MAG: type IV pilus assembly protein PilM [Candidatus Omnitrophota bacterium]|nr:type IV pilus assembly protein PilM [Candidatus Omnitrophota bacterium]
MIRPAGIDIGSSSIKLIELQEKRGKLELSRCAINAISGEDVKTSLKDLLAFSKLSSKRANISLSGPSVIVRYIEMPPMKREELKSAIKFEGGKYIPFDINEAILDCAILDKGPSGNANRVLLVAAKKDKVNSYMEIFKDAGLDIANIDVDTVAILNAFQRVGLQAKQENVYAMINIGARFSNMNIAVGAYPYFTRDLLWGGSDITSRIKESLGLNLDDAENLKRNPGDRKIEMSGVVMSALEKFITEVRMSFDYFETQFGKSIERLYMSGGGAYLFNMLDFLKENLGIEVVLWDPSEGIQISDGSCCKEFKDFPGQFAAAMGLALRK